MKQIANAKNRVSKHKIQSEFNNHLTNDFERKVSNSNFEKFQNRFFNNII